MNGIQEHQRRETFKRWWNYRGLWRESLDDQPSAAFVYRWLFISYICLYVLFIYLNPLSSIEDWIPITLFLMIPFIVCRVLWYWGKIKNNRHIISVLMYLMLFLIGVLVAWIGGALYRIFEIRELEQFIYETFGTWWDLYLYLIIPTLLVSPILLMWIQGWRQALIFSLILYYPFWVIFHISTGKGF